MAPESRLGPYVLERRLGARGATEIFLAKKPLGPTFKQVVVKRMRRELIDDERLEEMFMREAGILSGLSHPNVVQILDCGRADDGELYIALEYLAGITVEQLALRAWRAERALPIELALRVVADAARGLDYIHRQPEKLVHRDVSPDNLFFVADGTTKLLDFSVARGATMKLLTEQGERRGKINFMSPEHLESRELDGRADLFSLGVTAYWLLTGRYPFQGNNDLGIMRAILGAEPEPVRARNADVPPWVEQLVMCLLAKDQSARVPTGADVDLTIQARAQGLLDRDADVAFYRDLMDVTASDVDDEPEPMVAVMRGRTSVSRGAPRPVTFEASSAPSGEVRPLSPLADPFPGDTARLPTVPQTAESADVQILPFEAPTDDPSLFDDAPTKQQPAMIDEPAASVTLPTPPHTGSNPVPRAVAVELPVDEEGGDTVRIPAGTLVDDPTKKF